MSFEFLPAGPYLFQFIRHKIMNQPDPHWLAPVPTGISNGEKIQRYGKELILLAKLHSLSRTKTDLHPASLGPSPIRTKSEESSPPPPRWHPGRKCQWSCRESFNVPSSLTTLPKPPQSALSLKRTQCQSQPPPTHFPSASLSPGHEAG